MNATSAAEASAAKTAFAVLAAISFCHLLNDMMQSLLPAIYPILKQNYGLDFGQVGLLTFTFQFTASLLQPVIGLYTDRKPKPYSLPAYSLSKEIQDRLREQVLPAQPGWSLSERVAYHE